MNNEQFDLQRHSKLCRGIPSRAIPQQGTLRQRGVRSLFRWFQGDDNCTYRLSPSYTIKLHERGESYAQLLQGHCAQRSRNNSLRTELIPGSGSKPEPFQLGADRIWGRAGKPVSQISPPSLNYPVTALNRNSRGGLYFIARGEIL